MYSYNIFRSVIHHCILSKFGMITTPFERGATAYVHKFDSHSITVNRDKSFLRTSHVVIAHIGEFIQLTTCRALVVVVPSCIIV
jgi:hypothetical protein